MSAKNRFSIITIHRNGINRLRTFLSSAESVIDKAQDTITVVDNHSTDNSIKVLSQEFPNVKFISNNFNMGYAYACNQGITSSDGKFILICNNDLILPKDILSQLKTDFEQYPQAGLIGGQLISEGGKLSTSAGKSTTLLTELGLHKHKKIQPHENITVVESVVGACMAVRRSVVDTAGMLDPEFFFYYEESEWCIRIRQHGWQILLDKRLQIIHTGGASTQAIFAGARVEYHRSRLHFWKKVFPRQYYLLHTWTTLKMVLSSIYYTLVYCLSLGQAKKVKWRLMNHLVTLTWLALGKPKDWGLPDKEPSYN